VFVVRFAEGPTAEVSTRIEASASVVWALVADVGLPARFSSELQEAEWLDGATGPTVGARLRGRSRHPVAGEWETISVITIVEPERLLEWRVGDPDLPAATWSFELTPDADTTTLRQRVRLGPGPSGLTSVLEAMPDKEERIIERRLDEHRANMAGTVDGIKALAEAR
jgi:hypothetical protein